MKKLSLFILIAFAVTGLSVTASYAQSTGNNSTTLDPGCDPLMMTILNDQANAIRSRDRGYEMEMISREPSTLYLTCFDQALVVSSRLGYIFSDVITPNPPPPNKLAFKDTLLYPNWGASKQVTNGQTVYDSLASVLNMVITPLLNQWLGNVTASVQTPSGANGSNLAPQNPAVYNFYPHWTASYNNLTVLAKKIQGYADTIYNYQTGSLANQVNNYNQQVQKIENLVNSFPGLAWNDLPNALSKYNSYVQQLDQMAQNIEQQEKSTIGTQLNNIKNAVFNANIACTNLDDMWDGNGAFNNPDNTVTSFYSPEGPYNTLTPFYSMEDLLNYGKSGSLTNTLTVPGAPTKSSPTPATFYFNTELTRNTDTTLLKAALKDLSSTGPLGKPGNSTLWPAPPSLPSYFQTQDIIQQM